MPGGRANVNYTYYESGKSGYVAFFAGGGRVESERDALELVAACGESGTQNLLLPAECLGDEFFRLGSGLAGAVFLKLGQYRIRCAVVLPLELASRGRFADLVLEANRRDPALHFFQDQEPAAAWLLEG